jgi:alanyl-tRNA synthetase
MNSQEIRTRFLHFFEARQHAVIPSASLVPANDPTVLFTTAGMHPLVPYLLGEPHPLGKRLVDVQKCVRTDDIDEVGDNRHNTFFEMLGNWSLGDYFKDESLRWSFEFLTSKEEGLGLNPENIYVTVFGGNQEVPADQESIAVWQQLFAAAGLSNEVDKPLLEGGRIFTLSDNWWGPAGQTGPCGPDSEIYYDTDRGIQTLPNGMPDFESGRLVEIWNNVFMQFLKTEHARFEPLTQNNVDTGMGLERISMVCQGAETIFETDLFAPILEILPAEAKEVWLVNGL